MFRKPARRVGAVRPAFRFLVAAGLIVHMRSPAGSVLPAPSAQAAACNSPANCLSMMTLAEKIGQMTQANKNALSSPNDIGTYFLGSLLSGGGEGPNGSGG